MFYVEDCLDLIVQFEDFMDLFLTNMYVMKIED